MLNIDNIIRKRDKLNKSKDYLPLLLHRYVSIDYFERVPDKVLKEYFKKRTLLQGASNPSEFLKQDLLEWIDKHPEYKDFIKG